MSTTCALCGGDPRIFEARPHAIAIFPTGSQRMSLIVTYPLCERCRATITEVVRGAVVGAIEGTAP